MSSFHKSLDFSASNSHLSDDSIERSLDERHSFSSEGVSGGAGVLDREEFISVSMGAKTEMIPLHALADAERTVADMYSEFDLSSLPLFKGGLINFGYWEGISLDHELTELERIRSEEELYYKLLGSASIGKEDSVLEVGCGLGFGCRIIRELYSDKEVVGLDFSEAQLKRARIRQEKLVTEEKIKFLQGAAEAMPLESAGFSRVVSLEAAQHFRDVHAFVKEAYRVLKSGGKLGVATFFAKATKDLSKLAEYIPSIKDKVDNVVPISYFIRILEEAGFEAVECSSIGDHVWPGYDKWIKQTALKDSWNKNWIRSYKEDLLDYYMMVATKP